MPSVSSSNPLGWNSTPFVFPCSFIVCIIPYRMGFRQWGQLLEKHATFPRELLEIISTFSKRLFRNNTHFFLPSSLSSNLAEKVCLLHLRLWFRLCFHLLLYGASQPTSRPEWAFLLVNREALALPHVRIQADLVRLLVSRPRPFGVSTCHWMPFNLVLISYRLVLTDSLHPLHS